MTAAPHASSQGASSVNTLHGDDGLSAFMRVRPRLFGIAYRMLGNAAEAEDVVQDVWVRWQIARIAASFATPPRSSRRLRHDWPST
ncbi:MAG TPA: sigma factor [Vicinamibacterales bacterium]|jgi:RNA polymerase sigma-70 factor (ECF subfamily)|nr:sigma factor [Vicinamibacterales bacterium]